MTKNTIPDVLLDAPTTSDDRTDLEPPVGNDAFDAEEVPFESSEMGLGGFFPHLDTPTDS